MHVLVLVAVSKHVVCVCVCVGAASICPSKQSWQTNLMWPRKGQPHSNCLSLTLCTAHPSLSPFSLPSALVPPFFPPFFLFFNFNPTSCSPATSVKFFFSLQRDAREWKRLAITTISRAGAAVAASCSQRPTWSAAAVDDLHVCHHGDASDLRRRAGSKDSSG